MKVKNIISGCTACHSVIITEDGKAYTFGRYLEKAVMKVHFVASAGLSKACTCRWSKFLYDFQVEKHYK
jgi:hypothetical protein